MCTLSAPTSGLATQEYAVCKQECFSDTGLYTEPQTWLDNLLNGATDATDARQDLIRAAVASNTVDALTNAAATPFDMCSTSHEAGFEYSTGYLDCNSDKMRTFKDIFRDTKGNQLISRGCCLRKRSEYYCGKLIGDTLSAKSIFSSSWSCAQAGESCMNSQLNLPAEICPSGNDCEYKCQRKAGGGKAGKRNIMVTGSGMPDKEVCIAPQFSEANTFAANYLNCLASIPTALTLSDLNCNLPKKWRDALRASADGTKTAEVDKYLLKSTLAEGRVDSRRCSGESAKNKLVTVTVSLGSKAPQLASAVWEEVLAGLQSNRIPNVCNDKDDAGQNVVKECDVCAPFIKHHIPDEWIAEAFDCYRDNESPEYPETLTLFAAYQIHCKGLKPAATAGFLQTENHESSVSSAVVQARKAFVVLKTAAGQTKSLELARLAAELAASADPLVSYAAGGSKYWGSFGKIRSKVTQLIQKLGAQQTQDDTDFKSCVFVVQDYENTRMTHAKNMRNYRIDRTFKVNLKAEKAEEQRNSEAEQEALETEEQTLETKAADARQEAGICTSENSERVTMLQYTLNLLVGYIEKGELQAQYGTGNLARHPKELLLLAKAPINQAPAQVARKGQIERNYRKEITHDHTLDNFEKWNASSSVTESLVQMLTLMLTDANATNLQCAAVLKYKLDANEQTAKVVKAGILDMKSRIIILQSEIANLGSGITEKEQSIGTLEAMMQNQWNVHKVERGYCRHLTEHYHFRSKFRQGEIKALHFANQILAGIDVKANDNQIHKLE